MKKTLIQVFILKKIVLLCIVFGFNAQAKTQTREFTYEVYAGGIHAVQAKFNFQVEKNDYNISVDAKTRGLLGSLAPWEGIFQTEGSIANAAFSPQEHQSISVWRGEKETKTFTYKNNELTSVTIDEEGKPLENRTLDPALTNSTTDILSATLAVMDNMIKTNECIGTSDIYDGKRRFTMQFRDKGQRNLTKSSYNIFSGPARLCTIEVEPKGGRWHKKPRGWLSIQEQGRDKGTLPSIWMAKVDGFDYAIPVKVMVKTDYGTLMMHLTNAK